MRQWKDHIWKREHGYHSYNLQHQKAPKRTYSISMHTYWNMPHMQRHRNEFCEIMGRITQKTPPAKAHGRLFFLICCPTQSFGLLLFLLSHSLVDMVEFHLDLIKDWWSMMIFPLSSSLHQPDNKVEHKRCKKFLILGRFQTHSWLSVHWSSKHFMMLHVKDVVWNYCTTFN